MYSFVLTLCLFLYGFAQHVSGIVPALLLPVRQINLFLSVSRHITRKNLMQVWTDHDNASHMCEPFLKLLICTSVDS